MFDIYGFSFTVSLTVETVAECLNIAGSKTRFPLKSLQSDHSDIENLPVGFQGK